MNIKLMVADFAFDSVQRDRMTYLSELAPKRIPNFHHDEILREIDL